MKFKDMCIVATGFMTGTLIFWEDWEMRSAALASLATIGVAGLFESIYYYWLSKPKWHKDYIEPLDVMEKIINHLYACTKASGGDNLQICEDLLVYIKLLRLFVDVTKKEHSQARKEIVILCQKAVARLEYNPSIAEAIRDIDEISGNDYETRQRIESIVTNIIGK